MKEFLAHFEASAGSQPENPHSQISSASEKPHLDKAIIVPDETLKAPLKKKVLVLCLTHFQSLLECSPLTMKIKCLQQCGP